MKFIIKVILIAGLCYLLQLWLPFWIVAVVAFVINLAFRSSGSDSFFSSFIAVSVLWFIVAYSIDSNTEGILSEKIALLFSMNSLLITLVTAFVGGLVAGFGGLTARMLFSRKTKERYSKYYS